VILLVVVAVLLVLVVVVVVVVVEVVVDTMVVDVWLNSCHMDKEVMSTSNVTQREGNGKVFPHLTASIRLEPNGIYC